MNSVRARPSGALHKGPALWRVLSIIGFLALWTIISAFAASDLCPSPGAVFQFILSEARSGDLFYHLAVTLARVAAAFLIAMLFGCIIGIWLGRSKLWNRIFDSWVIFFLNLPALVVIVLSFIWLGLNEIAAVFAVALNKIPNVIVTIREGARALDPELEEMARLYRFSRRQTVFDVILPQLQPYFAAASRSGIALIWKIVLVVELLGRPNGVGFQIHLYFQLFDVRAILGYTLAFVLVMLSIEFLAVQPLEERANRWRKQTA